MTRMRKLVLVLSLATLGRAQRWQELPSLPEPVTNNAVATMPWKDGYLLFSMLGLQEPKTYAAITKKAWLFDSARNRWFRMPDVPGAVGRLASTAQAIHGKVYLFGGYTVDKNGKEISLADVDVFTPGKDKAEKGTWSKAAPMPVPVDDSVSVLYADRYVILISGWSQTDNVRDVQVFDTKADKWSASTPIPGTPVFGHAGGIALTRIVYCGGAYRNPKAERPKYIASEACWEGIVKDAAAKAISWKRVADYPGDARYRSAAAGTLDFIHFVAGTNNPYNYNGVGYNGVASQPSEQAFAWNACARTWEQRPGIPASSMDHRGLAVNPAGLFLIGGTGAGQRVMSQVWKLRDAPLRCTDARD